jgi:hypothetical protein
MNNLSTFINTKMKMTSYYQPLIILCMIENNGSCSLDAISNMAIDLGLSDKSTKDKLKIHPKTVLAKHNIAHIVDGSYVLDHSCTVLDRNEVVMLCNAKITQFKQR